MFCFQTWLNVSPASSSHFEGATASNLRRSDLYSLRWPQCSLSQLKPHFHLNWQFPKWNKRYSAAEPSSSGWQDVIHLVTANVRMKIMRWIFLTGKKRTILFIFNVRHWLTPWLYNPRCVLCNFLQMIFDMVLEPLKPLLCVFLDVSIWSILWLSSCVIKNLCWMMKTASSIWASEAALCTTYVLQPLKPKRNQAV